MSEPMSREEMKDRLADLNMAVVNRAAADAEAPWPPRRTRYVVFTVDTPATVTDEQVAGEFARMYADDPVVLTGWWVSPPAVGLRELRWAPYQEFGIPDPEAETFEAPAGPVLIMSTGYRGDAVIAYWERP